MSGNQAPSITSPAVANASENQTFVIDECNRPRWRPDHLLRNGGSDQAKFEINATNGVLRFKDAPDFEANASAAGNNAYFLIVRASDGSAEDNQTITVNVTDAVESTPNQAPAFQSDGNLSIPENQTFVFDFNATDSDGDTLTYSLAYGDDHLLFDINASTGILTFLTPKDFESPEDNDSNNRYEATIQCLRRKHFGTTQPVRPSDRRRGEAPTKPPSSNPTETCPFPKTKPSCSTSTRPIRTETPSPILLLTATTASFSITPTHPPESSLSSRPRISSHPRITTRTTATRPRSRSQTETLRYHSTCSSK